MHRVSLLLLLACGWRCWVLSSMVSLTEANQSPSWPVSNAIQSVVVTDDNALLLASRADATFNIDLNPSLGSCIWSWDPSALVYVTVGSDGKPGAAGVDDDGNAVVDDRGEMGATGTDDLVLTPGDVGYEDAETGLVTAAVLSRGAMRKVVGEAVIQGPGQVRIDLIDDQNRLQSRIVDLVSS